MTQSTANKTEVYVNEHPYIKRCLQQGLINYSALARQISEELDITNKTSQEAILIAARRLKDRMQNGVKGGGVRGLLGNSELTIKNKMIVFILDKNMNFEYLEAAQKEIRKSAGTIYVVEGSDIYTVITQEKYAPLMTKLKAHVLQKNTGVALINLKSPKEIEHVSGVIAYLTSLFAENGINIFELFSCWRDTLFVVDAKDVPKAMQVLQF